MRAGEALLAMQTPAGMHAALAATREAIPTFLHAVHST